MLTPTTVTYYEKLHKDTEPIKRLEYVKLRHFTYDFYILRIFKVLITLATTKNINKNIKYCSIDDLVKDQPGGFQVKGWKWRLVFRITGRGIHHNY